MACWGIASYVAKHQNLPSFPLYLKYHIPLLILSDTLELKPALKFSFWSIFLPTFSPSLSTAEETDTFDFFRFKNKQKIRVNWMLQILGENKQKTPHLKSFLSSSLTLYMWMVFLFVFKQEDLFVIADLLVILPHITIFLFTCITEAHFTF